MRRLFASGLSEDYCSRQLGGEISLKIVCRNINFADYHSSGPDFNYLPYTLLCNAIL